MTKIEIEDGEEETEVKKKITTPDGIEITFKTKTEIEHGKEVVKQSIEIEGAEVTTKLAVKEKFEDNKTKLKAKLSTGAEQDIIVLPDEALQIALNELQSTHGFVFEIAETVVDGQLEAVFKAKATMPGKLLGIFNTEIDLETLIDTQTGEIIQTRRPWWAFLIVGADEATVCHVSSEEKRVTRNVLITEVKLHLEHGDGIGECVVECNDGIIAEGVELCEIGDTQACTTTKEYKGTEACNSTCGGFESCVSTEFCGDSIVNGPEACDDGNIIIGDGCDGFCQIEIEETLNSTL